MSKNSLASSLSRLSLSGVLVLATLAVASPPAQAITCGTAIDQYCEMVNDCLQSGEGCTIDGCPNTSVCVYICGDNGDGVAVQYKATTVCAELCGTSGLGVAVHVKTVNACVEPCLNNSGEGYGVSVNGGECVTTGSVALCPSGTVGAHVDSTGACVPYSVPTVGLCPSGTVGAHVDSTGACVPYSVPTVGLCPSGTVGAHVDATGACVPYSVPTVGLCPTGSYGVVVNGQPTCLSGALLTSCTGADAGLV